MSSATVKSLQKPHRNVAMAAALTALMALMTLAVAGCGGGGGASFYVGDGGAPPVIRLDIAVGRVGPRAVRVDWSDDPYADFFTVARDGYALADVNAVSLIDSSVDVGASYCYQVSGYDGYGYLVSLSDTACITVGL